MCKRADLKDDFRMLHATNFSAGDSLGFKLVLSKKAVAGPKQQLPSPGRDTGNQKGLGGGSGRMIPAAM